MDSHSAMPVTEVSPAIPLKGVSVERISYHGWSDCYLIANGRVEAVIVPAIGRVMQLRLVGDAEGAFWENRALDGQLRDVASNDWINFGRQVLACSSSPLGRTPGPGLAPSGSL